MSGDLSADEIREKIEAGSSAWRGTIPSKEHDRFVGRVQQAVTIYESLVRPKDLRDELEGFERATRSPTAPIGQLVAGLSADAQHILSRSGPLPLPPNNPSASEAYYTDIRSRLVRGQRWKSERDKRRKVTEIVGPPKRMGRPPDADIDVLVGLISGAYVYATGKPSTRYETETIESALESIVEDVFRNMCIDEAYNSKKAVRRHIERRDSFKL